MTPNPLPWLSIERGDAPLLLSIPHAGTELPDIEAAVVSPWLARRDADWWMPDLYGFARDLGATIVRTDISRTVIDMNRDPSGASLYPGQATTGLCPTETFDGEPLYRPGHEPDADEIARRRDTYFQPYHAALQAEIARLRALHPAIVLYDCHSIRSVIPRLFDGVLPVFNLGTNSGASAAPALADAVTQVIANSGQPWVVNGRFKGGWITRAYGKPETGVHTLQMELGCRSYMTEPETVSPETWPTPYTPAIAAETQGVLRTVLTTALAWARQEASR